MHKKTKWAALLAGAVLWGAIFAGPVQAEPAPSGQEKAEQVDKQLSPGETEVLDKLKQLHKAHREQFKKEATAVLEQAVKEGKITREQADTLLHHKPHMKHRKEHRP